MPKYTPLVLFHEFVKADPLRCSSAENICIPAFQVDRHVGKPLIAFAAHVAVPDFDCPLLLATPANRFDAAIYMRPPNARGFWMSAPRELVR